MDLSIYGLQKGRNACLVLVGVRVRDRVDWIDIASEEVRCARLDGGERPTKNVEKEDKEKSSVR